MGADTCTQLAVSCDLCRMTTERFRKFSISSLIAAIASKPIERAGLALVVASFFAFPLYLMSRPDGNVIPLARTGGPFPGELTCGTAGCHNTTPNSGPGDVRIAVDGVPISDYLYSPGETVALTVTVADPGQQRWGFQITARDADDGCMSAGSFSASADAIVRTAGAGSGCDAGREFATHGFAKSGGSSGVFEFGWTAPAQDVGPIIFAAAGNAANGNNFPTGDLIYTTSETVEATEPPPPDPTPVVAPGGIVLSTLLPSVPSVSPLSIITLFGTDFGTETILFAELDGEGKVATILGGTCVEVNDTRSPIFAITPGQANVQAPLETGLGSASVVVIRDCDTPDEVRSAAEMVTVESATPAFFQFPQVADDGLIAARFNTGFAAVAPNGLFTDQFGPSRPAVPGDVVLLFGTGWGETEAALSTGELATVAGAVLPDATPMVTIGGVPIAPEDVFYVGVTPQTAGLFQLAIRIPAGTPPGNHEVVLTVYGKSTPVGPVIPVAASQSTIPTTDEEDDHDDY